MGTSEDQINEHMEALRKKIYAAIHEAEAFADKHELNFYIQPAYGMGGRYYGSTSSWSPSSETC
ncbi:hypothetical protein ADLP2_051 [Acinetobacter phage vB_AbaM_DLP2]|nr:hypothetical protein vBAbaPDP45_60 [Acinetobacter phage vB_AbaM_DP45]WBF78948.1 hypothetical protein ADLP2_051 [Acinetobacter phage vB_AbaM_DLP2]